MKQKLAQLAVQFVAASTALTDRLMHERRQTQERTKLAADKKAALLAKLLETGCVDEGQKAAAATILDHHDQTMDLLSNAVTKLAALRKQQEKQAGDIGRGVDPRSVGLSPRPTYESLKDNYVGRRTTEKTASDEAILAVLGDPRG